MNLRNHMIKQLHFKFEKDGDTFHAWSPDLPGCHTYGETQEEAITNLREAALVYIEDLLENAIVSSQQSVQSS